MTEERAIEVLGIMKSQMKEFGITARLEGLREMQEATVDVAVKALSEIQQYRAIGTVEECRAAVERQIGKKPRFYAHNYYCGNCGNLVGNSEFNWKRFQYCDHCGSAIDWYA